MNVVVSSLEILINVVGIYSVATRANALNEIVSKSCGFIAGLNVATKQTSLSGDTCLSTGRIGYNSVVIVGALLRAKAGDIDGKHINDAVELLATGKHGEGEKKYEKN